MTGRARPPIRTDKRKDMDIPTELIVLLIVVIVAAFVAQPFFARRNREQARQADRRTVALLRQRADLLAERNRIYAAIRELEFDYATNKLADEDYAEQRRKLYVQGVEVLRRLDALAALDESPAADPIEALVASLRGGGAVAAPAQGAAAAQAGFCPQCGTPYQAGDRFCGACGAQL